MYEFTTDTYTLKSEFFCQIYKCQKNVGKNKIKIHQTIKSVIINFRKNMKSFYCLMQNNYILKYYLIGANTPFLFT